MKSLTKKQRFGRWVQALLIALALPVFLVACSTTDEKSDAGSTAPLASEPATQATAPAPTKTASNVTPDQASALAKATTYAKWMNLSKAAIYNQLTSAAGEGFSKADADYAMSHLTGIDWNQNALAKAKVYQNEMHMASSKIHDQLTSQYGDKFTNAQADYAMAHLND